MESHFAKVQGVNVRNNPYVLATVLLMSAFLYLTENEKPIATPETSQVKVKKTPLKLRPLLLKNSFHAHELDETARSLVLEGPKDSKLRCSFDKGKSFRKCSVGEKISWSPKAYQNNFSFLVKAKNGNTVKFTPKAYNDQLSFHRCGRFLNKKTTELSFRNAVSKIKDTNKDEMLILCLDSGIKLKLKDGPIKLRRNLAIIGTHNKTPTIAALGDFPVLKTRIRHSFFII